MAAFAWSLAASPSCVGSAAAQERRIVVDVPAGRLADGIASLGRQAGVSIGADRQIPSETAPAVKGSMTVEVALARLLRRSSLRIVRLGPGTFRLEPKVAAARRGPPSTTPPTVDGPPIGDVVVTATKRSETLSEVAAPITVLAGRAMATELGDGGGTRTLAQSVTGLFATNLGPGRNRLFVRGIADSPFDGFGQATVSVQIDEARATYDAPDPDLRLYDMAQVELLKGPQGPLYGTGALGGVFRLVPAKPDLQRSEVEATTGGEAVSHGGAAGSLEAVVNVPVIEGRLALRGVSYRAGQGGWIDEVGTGRDVNHGVTTGGRLALRARLGSAWTLDVAGLSQSSSVANSQYVDGNAGSLTRSARLPEPQDTDFSLVSATATGPVGPLSFTGTASIAMQELRATYDAGPLAPALGSEGPASYLDDRRYQVLNVEARVAAAAGRTSWLAGVSVLSAATDATGTITGAARSTDVLQFHRRVSENALFGEGTLHIGERLGVTLGARLFRSQTHDERRELERDNGVDSATTRLMPSMTVSWRPGRDLIVFARLASALRPGGVDATGPSGATGSAAYAADELKSVDLGARARIGARLTLDADLFMTEWRGVQADYLDANGMVTTRNAGNAGNVGIDASLNWRPERAWSLKLGAVLQRARIDPNGSTAAVRDPRLPAVPDASANLELARDLTIGRGNVRLVGRANYTGASRLSFDPGLDRLTRDAATFSTAVTADRGAWRLRAGVDNLFDSRSDTFAFGNPFLVRGTAQRTPIKPRTVSLAFGRAW